MKPPRILDAHVDWAGFDADKFRFPACPICLRRDQLPLASVVINHMEFALARCGGCSLLSRTPLPDPRHLAELYSARYYQVDPSRSEHGPPSDLELQVGIRDHSQADHDSRAQKCLEEVASWLANPDIKIKRPDSTARKPRFLEIGGGRGYLQEAARTVGWETVGVEISPHAIKAAIAKGLMVLPVPIEKLAFEFVPYRNYFDLIAFFDFLEHVTDPAGSLRVIRELLADDGTIIFRIPVTVGDQVPSLHLIDHLWHFSTDTLRRLLEKEGFEIYLDRDSGRFTEPNGIRFIQNWTFYARKALGDASTRTSPP